MSLKNLLLAYSGEASFASSLAHAIRLARHHDAWITAIMRNGPSYIDRYGAGLTDALRAQLLSSEEADVKTAVTLFRDAVGAAGLDHRAEFLLPDQTGGLRPSEMARHYDLVITGPQSDLPGEEHHAASPDLIALRSGRPVVVVPGGYDAATLTDHVLVAWDDKRSVARALGDAMGILEGKRQATILTVGGARPATPADGGIMRHLERHGIAAQHLHKTHRGRNVASVIKDTADEVGAGLIVMGAYEHSKLTQDLFGGVTHEVIRTTRVPVFMSH
ncbi:Universal stress protein family protein [Lutimaribacter pacificus]|uniref:Universal stress protein family protein n=1 Tax=Lutimaribacter pacificus TaxID=391948 RepID=A0A1H0M1Q8_9RHOB|nr:universal stress protein [Lutimaribacter pacificus]SDO74389.1 Universal stress protein family protein [Lutimaribacter pacificus]SHK76750.1 Universal stress protein family protein [Lutimaribacter pacificus]